MNAIARDLRLPRFAAVASFSLALALVGCGGGSGTTDTGGTPNQPAESGRATSASFSPVKGISTTTGASLPLEWRYVVNNGETTAVNVLDVAMAMRYDPVVITVNPTTMLRTTTLRGGLSGTVQGQAFTGAHETVTQDQLLPATDSSTYQSRFNAQSAKLKLSGSVAGETFTLTVDSSMPSLTPACAWLPDRTDLHTLPVGTQLATSCNGSATITITDSSEPTPSTRTVDMAVTEAWTLQEVLPSFTVRGTAYANVVKLKRETVFPSLNGTLPTVSSTVWLAKGIGMVRMESASAGMVGNALVQELDSTNLTVQ